MNFKEKKMKWYTEVEMVDVETGEILTKSKVEREYIVKSKNKHKTEYKDGKGIRKFTWECERNRQQRINFT